MVTLLAHEWLERYGGAEHVFSELRTAFPDSRQYCLWNDDPSRFGEVEESWLARTFLRRHKALALPFFSQTWRHVDLANVDRVVVSSHSFAHHLAARAASRGIKAYAYVHTPARYLWDSRHDNRSVVPIPTTAKRIFRMLDQHSVCDEVSLAANSEFVRRRIHRAWGMDAEVIYPPVRVEQLQAEGDWRARVTSATERRVLEELPHEFILAASRFVPYKRLDLAMTLGGMLQLPVVIAGRGPQESQLRSRARSSSVPIEFVISPSDELLLSLFQRACLYVFMGVEDFGIMPVEAMALGTPVLVNEVGGARESVGLLGGGAISSCQAGELADKAREAIALDMSIAVERASQLSTREFQRNIGSWVN